jgi:hypothetical protein
MYQTLEVIRDGLEEQHKDLLITNPISFTPLKMQDESWAWPNQAMFMYVGMLYA